MLIGGDRKTALGPYASSAEVLAEGLLADAGIHEVGVAGYPEGHPAIPADVLRSDLETKQELTARQGLGLEIVTQFSFIPSRVVEYCAELARTAPEIPVYVGMAGPTPNRTLRRYARHCGVSASLRALIRLGVSAAQAATHTEPGEQLAALSHYCAAREPGNVIGVHLYSFGGLLESALWMRRQCRPAPANSNMEVGIHA
jgi:methylenetetrahydrofolate reductase (NADPH)